jgi:predicted permease
MAPHSVVLGTSAPQHLGTWHLGADSAPRKQQHRAADRPFDKMHRRSYSPIDNRWKDGDPSMPFRTLLRRLRYFARHRQHEDDLRDEMAFHREMTREALAASGTPAENADARSRKIFGNDALIMNRSRDVWVWPWLQDITQDIRFAARILIKDRRFTIAAVVALALGIAVNNSVFAIINAAMIKDVPFEHPSQLMSIRTVDAHGRETGLSFAAFRELTTSATAFEGLSASANTVMNVSGEAQAPERFRGAYLSGNVFSILRTAPALGRTFVADDEKPGAAPVVLLGYGVWQRRYGGDASIVGRTIKVNDVPATVVGVLPQDFSFPGIAEMWQPLSLLPGIASTPRDARSLNIVGRLAPGASLVNARANVETIAAGFTATYPDTDRDVRLLVRSLKDSRPDTKQTLLTMMGAVGFVLLIACANLANLMLARSVYRSREIAVRASLGASRWRIVRQLLIECLLIAAVAGVAGLALSRIGVQQIAIAFNVIEPGVPLAQTKPYWIDASMDVVVYAFVGGLCLLTSVLFGIIPALQISKTDANEILKDGGRTTGGRRPRRWGAALMIAEVALTLVVLTGTGLLWRNFLTVYQHDLVVDTTGVATLQIALPPQRYRTHDARRQFFDRLDARLAAHPGLTSAALASHLPLVSLSGPPRQLTVEGRPAQAGTPPSTTFVQVGPRYFDTLAITLMRGRTLTASDSVPGRESAIVNELFARRYFADADPIGQRIQLAAPSPTTPATPWLTIVGVSQTVPSLGPARPRELEEPVVYAAMDLDPAPRAAVVVVRSHDGLAAAASTLREEVRALDPDLPLYGVESLDESIARTRFTLFPVWFAVLAAIALVVAAVGLYAVTSHGVAQRTQEIGIRVALGARAGQIVWLFLRRTLAQLAAGVAVGIVGALWIGQLLQAMLPQTSARDPMTIGVVIVLLVTIAAVATLLPSRLAARVDPHAALRSP